MKKQTKKLMLSKETVRSLESGLEQALGGQDTVGNSCGSLCLASRAYACLSPQTGG